MSSVIKIQTETITKLKAIRQNEERSYDATIRRLTGLPPTIRKKTGPKTVTALPCEKCGTPLQNIGDGLGTCPQCNTTAPILVVYTDLKARMLIKNYLKTREGQPTTIQEISSNTGVQPSQIEKILDKLSR